MATVNKDFKVKNGLIVEGTSATVDNYDVLTKKPDDQTYIIGLIGGSATPDATPDTVVLRDENADFSANMITSDLTGDVTGTVSDISNHNTDDLSEGTTNKYYTDGRVKDVLVNSTQTNIAITEVSGVLHITAENGVADSTTNDLTEGLNNLYFTDTRAKDAVSSALGTGIEYTNGSFDVQLGTGLETDGSNQIQIDRDTVDGWYSPASTATDLSTHEQATTGIHGVTGNIVGTSDSQTLTNKTLEGTVYLGVDNTNSAYIQTETDGAGNLTVHAGNDLTLSTNSGDIVLNPDGTAYVGSASAGNEIATNSYVDNAVSGLSWKQSVNVLANANVALTGSTPLSIDSHTVADGYRVLLTAQSTNSENGIYDMSITGGSYTLSRSADADAYTELIGAAVYVMEGTQFGATSWVQGDHYLTDFSGQDWTQFSGQGSVTAGTGITVDGLEVSVDRTTVDTWYEASGSVSTHSDLTTGIHGVTGTVVGTSDTQTLTSKTIDGGSNTITNIDNSSLINDSITINGYATALGDSVSLYSDDVIETNGGNNLYFTQSRARESLSAGNAISYNNGTGEIAVDASQLDTDDIAEGVTNHYYTDQRAEDAAGNLLANATKSNIQITYNAGVLSVTAENGVDDATTDDLDEGSTNLYFTDQRAVDALEAVVPNFTAVEIDSLAKQVAATTGLVATASTVTAFSFPKADYRSAKFLVKTAYGSHTEVAEVLLTLDTSDNIAITEYAIVGTNGSSMTISADVSGTDVRLRVTTVNNNSTVNVVGTLLA